MKKVNGVRVFKVDEDELFGIMEALKEILACLNEIYESPYEIKIIDDYDNDPDF